MPPIPMNFRGAAKRIDDVDLPTVGALIGVGEDEIHAVLDVESRGHGFDHAGRPIMLFEPHIFYRQLSGSRRDAAVRSGLAYPNWGQKPYPADSYPRLVEAMKIDETAALKSASWGLGQVMGSNHTMAGYASVQDMVADFCADEETHLRGMIAFIKSVGLDRALRSHNWVAFARGYNGPGYAKNGYDVRLARRFAYWRQIPDTPIKQKVWKPDSAADETRANDDAAPHVVGVPPLRPGGGSFGGAGSSISYGPSPAPSASVSSVSPPVSATHDSALAPASGGFWARFRAAFRKGGA